MAPFRDVAPAVRARMARIRKTNTRPELRVRKLAHKLGYRFTLHRKDLPGTPDIVMPRYRSVIFVHGCFWHRHDCHLGRRIPSARPEYWLPKLERNVARDYETQLAIAATGWRSLVVWECETRALDGLSQKLHAFLQAASIDDNCKRRGDKGPSRVASGGRENRTPAADVPANLGNEDRPAANFDLLEAIHAVR